MQLLLGTRKSIFQHVADRLPRPTVELHQSQVLDRLEVPTAGAYPDARQQQRRSVVLERRRLPHDVFAGQVVPAPFEHLNQGLGGRIAEKRRAVVVAGVAIVFVLEAQPFLDRLIVFPRGIVPVLRKVAEITPTEFSSPAGFSTVPIDAAMSLTMNTGCQLRSAAIRIA
jgi:hypothetical protein